MTEWDRKKLEAKAPEMAALLQRLVDAQTVAASVTDRHYTHVEVSRSLCEEARALLRELEEKP